MFGIERRERNKIDPMRPLVLCSYYLNNRERAKDP
jgi:hypothetical protein